MSYCYQRRFAATIENYHWPLPGAYLLDLHQYHNNPDRCALRYDEMHPVQVLVLPPSGEHFFGGTLAALAESVALAVVCGLGNRRHHRGPDLGYCKLALPRELANPNLVNALGHNEMMNRSHN